jgi:soluble lytic murein transglycosylase-like protein
MTGLSSSQRKYLTMVMQVLNLHPKWVYIDPAWIMAIMNNESGYNPTVVNATGRQDGLMQVIPSTAQQMSSVYGIPSSPQTDPMTSILCGTAYLDYSARQITQFRKTPSLPLWDLVQAYNEGLGAVEQGKLDTAYLIKFQNELPIIEAQMAATAVMTAKMAITPKLLRNVIPV